MVTPKIWLFQADQFNNYYISIGNSLSNSVTPATNNHTLSATSTIASNLKSLPVYLRTIPEAEVHSYIHSLNSAKSSGKFGVPIKYIKLSVAVISPILTKIYNQCILDGNYPDILKIAEVHQRGPKNNCSNYHPFLSYLSPFSKIFEKCLHFQLYNYLTQNHLLRKSQYGFVKKSSTIEAVFRVEVWSEYENFGVGVWIRKIIEVGLESELNFLD